MKTLDEIIKEVAQEIRDQGVQVRSHPGEFVRFVAERYAEQQAIEFAEWVGRRYKRYATGWVPIWKRAPYKEENILTTETLYQKFKEEQK